jgi:hypothetical protein
MRSRRPSPACALAGRVPRLCDGSAVITIVVLLTRRARGPGAPTSFGTLRLSGMQRPVTAAQASRSRAQALADRFAALRCYLAAIAAAITILASTSIGHFDEATSSTITLLIIACPHAPRDSEGSPRGHRAAAPASASVRRAEPDRLRRGRLRVGDRPLKGSGGRLAISAEPPERHQSEVPPS